MVGRAPFEYALNWSLEEKGIRYWLVLVEDKTLKLAEVRQEVWIRRFLKLGFACKKAAGLKKYQEIFKIPEGEEEIFH